MKRLRYRLEYVLLRAAIGLLNRFPDGPAEAAGAWLGGLGYWPLRIRRAQAETNVRRAFPERDESWVQRVVRDSYRHLGRETVVMLRLSRLTPERVRERTELVDFEKHERTVREGGRGMVVVAGHLGNWELGAAMAAARGIPMDAIAVRQKNPFFDRYIVRTRRRLGVEIIYRHRASRQALRALRAGHAVAFAADQNAGRSGLFVPFFGRPASTFRGAALMAVRTGAPLLLAVPLRQPDGSYRMRLEDVAVDREGELDDVVYRLTAAFTAQLEAAVRAEPGQYLWQHRRWRTRPPEERPAPPG
ncbi:MAG TPA: lysophospholipid acyltransferase family protein [Longimicrobiales bacterium]|nr:lysophospholipid acyltransferase family protein [Longimicrobiales bacterium]